MLGNSLDKDFSKFKEFYFLQTKNHRIVLLELHKNPHIHVPFLNGHYHSHIFYKHPNYQHLTHPWVFQMLSVFILQQICVLKLNRIMEPSYEFQVHTTAHGHIKASEHITSGDSGVKSRLYSLRPWGLTVIRNVRIAMLVTTELHLVQHPASTSGQEQLFEDKLSFLLR